MTTTRPAPAPDPAALPPGHQYVMVRCSKCPFTPGKTARGASCAGCKGTGYVQGIALLPGGASALVPVPGPEAQPVPPIEVDGHPTPIDVAVVPTQAHDLPERDAYMAADDGARQRLLSLAGLLLRAVKGWRLHIAAKHKDGVDAAHREHKRRTTARNTEDADPAALESYLAARVNLYLSAEQTITQRRQQILDKQLADEAAEQQRADAQALRDQGEPEAAAQVEAAPPPVVPIVHLPPAARGPVGISQRSYWAASVFDLQALCLAVAEGQVPPEAVEPNMTYLNDRARALKKTLAIPGVKAEERTGVSTRA